MKYELHITCEVDDRDAFKAHCESIGIKPIIIETENRDTTHSYQVMTSSKHEGDDYIKTMGGIVLQLATKFKIIRKKVEIQPEEIKHPNHIYYESHLRLKLPKCFDFTKHKAFIIDSGFHLSKNIFKQDETHYYQMLTYRSRELNYHLFCIIIQVMQSTLSELGIEYDKVEIEECIYDSNESVDTMWLGNEKLTTRMPNELDIATHRALHPISTGIEPIYIHTLTRSTKVPENGGKIILNKNRCTNG